MIWYFLCINFSFSLLCPWTLFKSLNFFWSIVITIIFTFVLFFISRNWTHYHWTHYQRVYNTHTPFSTNWFPLISPLFSNTKYSSKIKTLYSWLDGLVGPIVYHWCMEYCQQSSKRSSSILTHSTFRYCFAPSNPNVVELCLHSNEPIVINEGGCAKLRLNFKSK